MNKVQEKISQTIKNTKLLVPMTLIALSSLLNMGCRDTSHGQDGVQKKTEKINDTIIENKMYLTNEEVVDRAEYIVDDDKKSFADMYGVTRPESLGGHHVGKYSQKDIDRINTIINNILNAHKITFAVYYPGASDTITFTSKDKLVYVSSRGTNYICQESRWGGHDKANSLFYTTAPIKVLENE